VGTLVNSQLHTFINSFRILDPNMSIQWNFVYCDTCCVNWTMF